MSLTRHSHLQQAHLIWGHWLQEGHWAVDATCGNGHDTLKLSELVGASGGVIALDIQEEAIESAKSRVKAPNVHFFCQSHASFPSLSQEHPIHLIAYNLGYLPGGEKDKTTLKESTLMSLKAALKLVTPGGLISLTCYPGHPEGAAEEALLLDYVNQLDSREYNVSHTQWKNRNEAPSLLIIQRNSYHSNQH
jgi:SAM-dependent methyltransferase